MKAFELRYYFPVEPDDLYSSWLDSNKHAAMTGGFASVSDQIGASFSAWDGYISGHNIELVPNARIVQKWRTSDFGDSDLDSTLEILIRRTDGGSELKIVHSDIPEGQPDYGKGWLDNYLKPMEQYFKKTHN